VGRPWVGLSYDGRILTGFGAMARTEEDATAVVREMTEQEGQP
jgi:hypothetical protein